MIVLQKLLHLDSSPPRSLSGKKSLVWLGLKYFESLETLIYFEEGFRSIHTFSIGSAGKRAAKLLAVWGLKKVCLPTPALFEPLSPDSSRSFLELWILPGNSLFLPFWYFASIILTSKIGKCLVCSRIFCILDSRHLEIQKWPRLANSDQFQNMGYFFPLNFC